MSEQQQIEPTVAAGEPTFGANGEVTLDGVTFPPTEAGAAAAAPESTSAAVEPVAEPVAAQSEPVAPPADPFTPIQLQNGDYELKLETGQVFTAKSERELLGKLAQSKLQSEQYIQELKGKPQQPSQPSQPSVSPDPANPDLDPGVLAVYDMIAPGVGFASGKEMIEGIRSMQQFMQQSRQEQQNMQLASEFMQANPDFYNSKVNTEKFDETLRKSGMPMTLDNLNLVHAALKQSGAYEAAPVIPRTAAGQFAPRTAPAANPLPPSGSAPANTGKGTPTAEEMMSMPMPELEKLMQTLTSARQ